LLQAFFDCELKYGLREGSKALIIIQYRPLWILG
jgi:hypothetical protein